MRGALNPTQRHACVSTPHFCIIAISSSATISYPRNPGREAWKLAASAAPTHRKISNATLAAGTEAPARVPTGFFFYNEKKKDSLPRKRH